MPITRTRSSLSASPSHRSRPWPRSRSCWGCCTHSDLGGRAGGCPRPGDRFSRDRRRTGDRIVPARAELARTGMVPRTPVRQRLHRRRERWDQPRARRRSRGRGGGTTRGPGGRRRRPSRGCARCVGEWAGPAHLAGVRTTAGRPCRRGPGVSRSSSSGWSATPCRDGPSASSASRVNVLELNLALADATAR